MKARRKSLEDSAISSDDGHREPVITFTADGLQGSGGQPRFGAKRFEQFARALNTGVGTIDFDYSAVSDHIVANDQRAFSKARPPISGTRNCSACQRR